MGSCVFSSIFFLGMGDGFDVCGFARGVEVQAKSCNRALEGSNTSREKTWDREGS